MTPPRPFADGTSATEAPQGVEAPDDFPCCGRGPSTGPLTITIPAPNFPPVRDRKTGKLKPVNPWLNANHRGHRIPEAKKIAAWREAATKAAEGFAPLRTPVHITAHIFKPRRGIYDPNNLNVTSKACVDALVSCGVLAADDYHHVIGPDHRHGGIGDASLVLEITELGGAA
jgi:hypothetical protein